MRSCSTRPSASERTQSERAADGLQSGMKEGRCSAIILQHGQDICSVFSASPAMARLGARSRMRVAPRRARAIAWRLGRLAALPRRLIREGQPPHKRNSRGMKRFSLYARKLQGYKEERMCAGPGCTSRAARGRPSGSSLWLGSCLASHTAIPPLRLALQAGENPQAWSPIP